MLAIPQTPLWTPRRGAWWRLPRFDALAMAHLKKSSSTGRLLKTSTGHLTKGCGSCDCSAYSYMRVTLSGVTVCCLEDPGGIGISTTLSGDPNGTWDLPYDPGYASCAYRLFTGLYWQIWSNTGCSGSVLTSLEWQLIVIMSLSSQYDLQDRAGGNSPIVVQQSSAFGTGCTEVVLSNGITACDTSGYSNPVAYGGSATITPIP